MHTRQQTAKYLIKKKPDICQEQEKKENRGEPPTFPAIVDF